MRVINFGEFMGWVKFSYVLYDKSIFTVDLSKVVITNNRTLINCYTVCIFQPVIIQLMYMAIMD
jgi:hypothetical protein